MCENKCGCGVNIGCQCICVCVCVGGGMFEFQFWRQCHHILYINIFSQSVGHYRIMPIGRRIKMLSNLFAFLH